MCYIHKYYIYIYTHTYTYLCVNIYIYICTHHNSNSNAAGDRWERHEERRLMISPRTRHQSEDKSASYYVVLLCTYFVCGQSSKVRSSARHSGSPLPRCSAWWSRNLGAFFAMTGRTVRVTYVTSYMQTETHQDRHAKIRTYAQNAEEFERETTWSERFLPQLIVCLSLLRVLLSVYLSCLFVSLI